MQTTIGKRRLPTNCEFVGSIDKVSGLMDGFGSYTYWDGSEYRGFFKTGRFHGYGLLTLSAPLRCSFSGYFNEGKFEKIMDMTFPDGLSLEGSFIGNEVNFDMWSYLSERDRRFYEERKIGIPGVGPNAFLTHEKPERNLRPGRYDTTEGIFNTCNNFISRIPKPFRATRFVGCEEEVEWILDHCRSGYRNNVWQQDVSFFADIIQTNISENKKHENYPRKEKTDLEENCEFRFPIIPSCSSIDSFKDTPIMLDYGEQPGRVTKEQINKKIQVANLKMWE